ncbi:tRNA nucleotidyltransferase [Pseudomonas phage Waldo5]|uniref:tRNA nucleotidyltransferase n=1 Tax=Pseudomonas phage Waldo5 TaxID=2762290 RepID=A0A7G8LJN5_9CAUD|nr:tRNA nucleotidyltransferase [Pseudomonas phage Waldo5]
MNRSLLQGGFDLCEHLIGLGIQRGIEGATIRFLGKSHWTNLVRLREDARGSRAEKMEAKWLALIAGAPLDHMGEREVADVVS